jgi:uncharacterized protein YjiS (DUF1127 family)
MQKLHVAYAQTCLADLAGGPYLGLIPITSATCLKRFRSPAQDTTAMTALDTTRPFVAAPHMGGRVSAFFAAVSGAIVDWNDARITRKSLSRLSARELDDIGLTYGDIDEIAARGGRF